MLLLNGKKVTIEQFLDGTPRFNLSQEVNEELEYSVKVQIDWLFDNMAELFYLTCLVDKIRTDYQYLTDLELYLPYIPNARMDRVKNKNDFFTLKTFANQINQLNFRKVLVKNAHSNVALGLIDRVEELGCEDDLQKILSLDYNLKIDTIFFPDEGAVKRYSDYSVVKKYPIVMGLKKRDWSTGKIQSLEVIGDPEFIKNKNILIVDDISSRGGSFYFSGLKLHQMGCQNVYLYVTHCENSIDWKKLHEEGFIKRIFTTESIFRLKDIPVIEII